MTQYAATAYNRTAQTATTNRELEAMLLIKAATRLKQVQSNWDHDQSDLDGALHYNRKLWTILSVAATDTDNGLPDDIKNNMALIAIFIFNRSLDLITDPRPDLLTALIDINHNIAQGLMTNPSNSGAADQKQSPP